MWTHTYTLFLISLKDIPKAEAVCLWISICEKSEFIIIGYDYLAYIVLCIIVAFCVYFKIPFKEKDIILHKIGKNIFLECSLKNNIY